MLHSFEDGENVALGLFRGEDIVSSVQTENSTSLVNFLGNLWRQSTAFTYLESLFGTIDTGSKGNHSAPDLQEIPELAFAHSLLTKKHSQTHPSPSLAQCATAAISTCCENGQSPNEQPGIVPPISDPARSERSLPPNWEYLLNLYFTNTQKYIPILEQEDILQFATELASRETRGKPSSRGHVVQPGQYASLLAALAFAAYQEALCTLSRNDGLSNINLALSLRLKVGAATMVMDSDESQGLEHVQTLSILALLEMSSGSLGKAWTLVGRGVYIMTDLVMITAPETTQERHQDDRYRLVLRGLFVIETMIAFRLGRRPYLQSQDLSTAGALRVNRSTEWEFHTPFNRSNTSLEYQLHSETEKILETFEHFVSMLCIANEFLHAPNHSASHIEKALRQFRVWFDNLLPDERDTVIASTRCVNPSSAPESLNLSLCATSMYLMLQIKELISNEHLSSIPTQIPTTYSSVPTLLGRVQEAGLVSLYPMIDTYIYFMNSG
ncbi:hypothetical protein EDB81DRAFT_889699 [Dactylonectria macrodidyma]|uniref:Xylanolytic transcriptional activator regulatory domain-containing protein n=1 Tax=Dactylonectria macrodidyma TaxID=307937 RepID=A0A9P9IKU7_9HYPO|nr:hypothetical protein EDB81DRAFT_889699 [Dactylonectria macrodidyma]